MLFVIVPLVLFVMLLLGLKTVKTSVEAFQEKAKLKRQDMDYANAHFPLVKEAFEALWTKDDYFAHDETHMVAVPSVKTLNNVAHGVHLSRSGVSGITHNQRFSFEMEINNPALTAQVMTSCARAAVRLRNEGRYGAYTLIEIPPILLLPGDAETNISALV